MNQQHVLAAVLAAAVAVSPASGEAGDQATDPRALASSLDLTGSGVRQWLEALGVEGGGPPVVSERLLVVNTTGTVLTRRDGVSASVHVDSEVDSLLLRPGTAAVLVHNHPANVGLSGPDLHHLTKPGVAAVVAIGHDGSVFLAVRAIQGGHRRAAEELERADDVGAQDLDRARHARFAAGAEAVGVRPADSTARAPRHSALTMSVPRRMPPSSRRPPGRRPPRRLRQRAQRRPARRRAGGRRGSRRRSPPRPRRPPAGRRPPCARP
jgi:hypothetical protein